MCYCPPMDKEPRSIVVNLRLAPPVWKALTDRAAAESRPVRSLAALLIAKGLAAEAVAPGKRAP